MKKNNPLSTRKGFSLIELMVSMAIMSLLFTVIFATLNSAQERSRDQKRLQDLKRIQLAVENYYDDYGHYPDTGPYYEQNGIGYGYWVCFDCTYGTYYDGPIYNPSAPNIRAALAPYLKNPPSDPQKQPANTGNGYLFHGTGSEYEIMSFVAPENMKNVPAENIAFWRCPNISADGQCYLTQQQISENWATPSNHMYIGGGRCKDGGC